LNNILEKYGCASEHAENGLMALEMLNKNSYDAVMMDCQLPEMDGYDATERIRRGETPDSGIKIIAITADVTEERKNRCLEAGMDCCIGKPFNKNEIYELLVKIKNSRK
jgi:CheY-like chemotaxis protein